MASWLIYLVFFTISWLIYFWYKERIQKETYNHAEYLRNKLQEWDWLYNNAEIDQAMDKVKPLEINTKPAEIAQPVREPSPADLVLDTAKEDKW